MKSKNSSKMGLGMLLGVAAGAIAGLFLAPKPGKELRKDAKNLTDEVVKSATKYNKKLQKKTPEQIAKVVFGDMSEASMKLAKKAHKSLAAELSSLEANYQKIDKKKYTAAVKTVVDGLKKDGEVPAATLKKLASYLQLDAKKLATKKVPAKRKTTRKS